VIETIPNPDSQELLDDRVEHLIDALGRRFPSADLEMVRKAWRVACLLPAAGPLARLVAGLLVHALACGALAVGWPRGRAWLFAAR
jgi:hypothetical protein